MVNRRVTVQRFKKIKDENGKKKKDKGRKCYLKISCGTISLLLFHHFLLSFLFPFHILWVFHTMRLSFSSTFILGSLKSFWIWRRFFSNILEISAVHLSILFTISYLIFLWNSLRAQEGLDLLFLSQGLFLSIIYQNIELKLGFFETFFF